MTSRCRKHRAANLPPLSFAVVGLKQSLIVGHSILTVYEPSRNKAVVVVNDKATVWKSNQRRTYPFMLDVDVEEWNARARLA